MIEEVIFEATELVANSVQFSLRWDGELTEKTLIIDWYDEDKIPPTNKQVFSKAQELLMIKNHPINLEAKKYAQRKKDGQNFSDKMNAKLNLYNINGVSFEQMEAIKDEIDTAFAQTQWFLEGGKWKSAQREINKVQITQVVNQELINEIKLEIDTYVSQNY